MSEDTAALVERVREAISRPKSISLLNQVELLAALDSLTAALERAERERDELGEVAEGQTALVNAAEARAQKAEAVVEAARRLTSSTSGFMPRSDFNALRDALAAVDEQEQA